MRKLLAASAVAAAVLALPSAAFAGGIAESCYIKSYVPATYAYGRQLVKGEYRYWEGLDNGPGLVIKYRHPATYVQTSRKVSDDSYILVPVACK